MNSAYDEKACTLLPGGTTTGVVVTITEALKLVEVVVPSDPVRVSVVTGKDDVKVVGTKVVILLGALSAREGGVLLELIEREGKSVKRSSNSQSK